MMGQITSELDYIYESVDNNTENRNYSDDELLIIVEENKISNNTNIFDFININNKLEDIIRSIDLYLKNDNDINVQDSNGNTLLMKAISIGYYDLSDYLIDNNADISITNKNGENALILSANYPYIMYLLINNNADINLADNNGKTALHYACTYGNLYSVKLLVKSGADINKKDILGKNILMYAVENEHLELIKYIIEKVKFNINEKDDWGQNAIFFATKIEIARYLIYNNIDYKESKNIGLKAYEVMKYNGYINVSTYLKNLGKRL